MRLLLLISLLFLPYFAFAVPSSGRSNYRHIGPGEGLSNFAVTAVYQDEFGIIWIGTADGLNRYDGQNIKVFRPKWDDPGSLYNNNVKDVCGNGNGKVYAIAKFALCEYDMRSEKFRTIKEDGIISIAAGRDRLWASGRSQVFSYDGQKLLPFYDFDTSVQINDLCELSSGQVLVCCTDGLYSIDSGRKAEKLIDGINVLQTYEDSKHRIWACTRDSGLLQLDQSGRIRGSWRHQVGNPGSISDDFIRTICEDGSGRFWIGTFKGLCVMSADGRQIDRIEGDEGQNSLPRSSIRSIICDSRGAMWIGSYYGGIHIYNRELDYFKVHDFYGVLAQDHEGCIWVGSEEEGLMRYRPSDGSLTSIRSDIFKQYSVKTLYFDPSDKALWVGTLRGGIHKIYLHSGKREVFTYTKSNDKSLPNKHIRAIIPYNEQQLLVATQSGAALLNKKTGESMTLDHPKIKGIFINTVMCDRDGWCWLSTSAGVIKYHPYTKACKEFFYDNAVPEMGTNLVICFYTDSRGRIWAGSSGSGLFLYDPQTDNFRCISSANSELVNDYILDIRESPYGYLLLATNGGFVRYDHDSSRFYTYNERNGFPIPDINSYGIFISSDKQIYVSGYRSLVSFSESSLSAQEPPGSIHFVSLRVNNSEVTAGDGSGLLKQSLLYQNRIDFYSRHTMFSISCSSPKASPDALLNTEYRLLGFDDAWLPYRNNILYTNLPPHSYKLEVRLIDGRTDKVMSLKSLEIVVHPPFYDTLLFKISILLLVLGIIAILIRFYAIRLKLNASLELEKMEKLKMEEVNQSKLQFFTYLSHEIRTPITLIRSNVENILSQTGVPTPVYSRVQGIQDNLSRVNNLIGELLTFKKQESRSLRLRFSQNDIIGFSAKIALSFSEYARNRNTAFGFENHSGSEKMPLWFDPVQLEKVYYNLLSNAFKHTPTDGSGKVSVALYDQGNSVRVLFSDNGTGIEASYQKLVFEPFGQVPGDAAASTGTGLGLSITKGIVEAHGGSIALESEKGCGATFSLVLRKGDDFVPEDRKKIPVDEDFQSISAVDEAFIKDIVKSQTAAGTLGSKILIVEDNEELRKYLAQLFLPFMKVITAPDGAEALRKLDNLGADIILSDLMMPNIDGFELCRKVKNEVSTSHIPFVILTAKVSEESELESFGCGADDYIPKPFNSKILITKCNNLLNTRVQVQRSFEHSKTINAEELTARNSLDKDFLERAIAIVEKHLDDSEFDVQTFSSEMLMGRTSFYMKLKGVTGQTPNRFAANIRLKKSIEIMNQRPDLTVSEVAFMTGFNSPSYFIKSFKEIYGLTPLAYQKSLKV